MTTNGLRTIDDQQLYMAAMAAVGIAYNWYTRGFRPVCATSDLMDRCGLTREQAWAAFEYAIERNWVALDGRYGVYLNVRKALR